MITNESQRAMIAGKIANMPKHLHKDDRQICLSSPVSQSQAAELLNVSERTIRSAKAVLDHGTSELVKEVEAGNIAVSDAAAGCDIEGHGERTPGGVC